MFHKNHLKNDESALKDGQEVSGLFSHDHSDLYRGSIVFVIQIHRLISTCRHLVSCSIATL